MSVFPPAVPVYAMSEPSGEKEGSVSTPGVAVSRRAEPPVRPTTHRSPAYSKAMRSLDTVGWRRRRVPWALSVVAQPNAAATMARCLVDIRLLVESETVILSFAQDDKGVRQAGELVDVGVQIVDSTRAKLPPRMPVISASVYLRRIRPSVRSYIRFG